MTHAKRGEQCPLCPSYVFGNGGKVSHGRAHVRRGEAVELFKDYGVGGVTGRYFFAPDDPNVEAFIAKGFEVLR